MSIKISELPQATSVGASDIVPIVQGGTTKQATAGMLNLDVYSTTEQRVGTWIDGKPIYRKTIKLYDTIGSTTAKTQAHGIQNLEKVIDYKARFTRLSFDVYTQFCTPCLSTNTSDYSTWLANVVYINDTTVTYYVGTNYTSSQNIMSDLYITIEYTKTTDNAN